MFIIGSMPKRCVNPNKTVDDNPKFAVRTSYRDTMPILFFIFRAIILPLSDNNNTNDNHYN